MKKRFLSLSISLAGILLLAISCKKEPAAIQTSGNNNNVGTLSKSYKEKFEGVQYVPLKIQLKANVYANNQTLTKRIDLNKDNEFDFTVGISIERSKSNNYYQIYSFISANKEGGILSDFAATVLKNNPYAWQTISLKPESLIGPENETYAIFSLPSTFYYAFDFGPPIRGGEFIGAGEQLIGMYFKINNNIHFGWMRIVLGNYGNEFTVIDAAYNTIPKFPIIAGATD